MPVSDRAGKPSTSTSRPRSGPQASQGKRPAARGPRRPEPVRGGQRLKVAALLAILAVGAVVAIVVATSLTSTSHGNGLPSGVTLIPETNHTHTTAPVQYDRVPPAGGAHNQVWLNCGVYTAPVPNENAVHSMEHGAVWITYQPDLDHADTQNLTDFVTSNYDGPQRYLVLSPYPGLPSPIVVSAWGAQLRLTSADDPRLAKFVAHYIGGKQGGEPGSPCTGGTGTPSA